MNESEISQYITGTFEGVDVVVASGDSFFFYNPDSNVPLGIRSLLEGTQSLPEGVNGLF